MQIIKDVSSRLKSELKQELTKEGSTLGLNTMNIVVKRSECNDDFTRGELFIDGEFFCYTLEDTERDVKIYGETAIPRAIYKIGFRELDTPKTVKYLKRFPDFFSYHLEIKNVEGFTGVLCHIGNFVTDTEGCLLLGDGKGGDTGALITSSTTAFTRFYKKVSQALNDGVEVVLEITGE